MFTIDQIKAVHSKVKSGANFPDYIQDIIKLGVIGYETYVTDGHTLFFGKKDYKIQSEAKYPPLEIINKSDKVLFQKELKEHQQGKTDYPTFCRKCAKSGVEKWKVNIATMTCIYYDIAGNEMLAEDIPTSKN